MPMAWIEPAAQAPRQYGNDPPLSKCPEPIAIVGMGCRFPGGASDPSKLWDLLISKRNAYSDFPPDRLNIGGFYHPNKDRPGSLYTKGGYFIEEDPRKFDHGFFGITPLETMNLDPTQRKLLETAYEAFENGGETLESLSGSRTGVYVGNILFEHYMMQLRDADFTLPYLTTGGSPTILSNRVNYVFNLKGPSMTLDTACSSSMYALHQAVNALRNDDCDAALVAGTQLILGPEIQISCARLGALSPTSQCHTFDAAADGYARAEGFGTLYIKRLSDAIKNGDPIRAVIRGTAVNTNGRTAGIAHPSPEGQETVIRSAYKNAGGLDPDLTGLFECHGTGTQVGDPLEVSAIGRVFASGRKEEDPLLIGSIKTNLGHAEAASGLAGLMKSVLAIENGIIPPTIGLVDPNPNIDFKGAKVKVVTEVTQWPADKPIRRASVNSFGFGGANAHCIIEHVSSVAPGYMSKGKRQSANVTGTVIFTVNGEDNKNGSQQKDVAEVPNGIANGHFDLLGKVNGVSLADPANKLINQQCGKTRQKVLLPFSAFDDKSLEGNIAAVSSILRNYNLSDLAYTLSARRSRFARRAFTVVSIEDGSIHAENVATGSPDLRDQLVGFVFTGQGAQWPGMGFGLYKEYEAFRASIRYQNKILGKLRDGPSWTIEEVLSEPNAGSRVHESQFSQALCTSIQIALVDLLRSWLVTPVVSVGHSSGEIAAAYASGYLTAAEAITMAYYRGKVVEMNKKDGRMLAIGLGPEEAQPYLHDMEGRVRIACFNSPSSTTLSGDADAIIHISERLEGDKVFNRMLKTSNNAYHSHHMAALGPVYEDLASAGLTDIANEIDLERKSLSRPPTLWVSSVTPSKDMTTQACGPSYWRKNLESPVQFMQAIETISEIISVQGSILVELGPHPALSGPLKQIRAKVGDKLGPSLSSIFRSSDNLEDMLKLAGALFLSNAPVDLTRVNAMDNFDGKQWTLARGSCCVDLPKYCFNYGPNIYYENRLNKEWRFRKHLRHDILGARIQGCSKFRPTWRNILRAKDLTWLREQRIHGQTILTSGAYLAMAIEAVSQVYGEDNNLTEIGGFLFKDIEIKSVLQVPDNDFGIDTVFDLRTTTAARVNRETTCFEFNVSSIPADGGDWVDVCSGSIEIKLVCKPFGKSITIAKSSRHTDIERWYARFTDIGAGLGPSFQLLSGLKAQNKDGCASAVVNRRSAEEESQESRYVIHPTTLDSVFLLCIIAGHFGQTEKIRAPFMPSMIKECTVWKGSEATTNSLGGEAFAKGAVKNSHLTATAQLWSNSGMPLLEVKGIELARHDAPEEIAEPTYDPFLKLVWKPDVTTMTNEEMRAKFPAPSKASEVGDKFDKLEELAIYSVIDIHEEQKHKYQDKRRDELQLFLDWIQRTVGYARDGKIPYGSEALLASPTERREKISHLNSALEDVIEAKLISAIFQNLSAILAGATSGLQVALENNLLAELYISGYSITRAYPQLINIIDSLSHKNPRMDIIEVGGGTGGATREILKALGAPIFKKFHSYTFTDVSNGFLSAVESEFSSHKGMTYKTLDLERNPLDQGYESTFDLVVASQVLHTTSSILKSVQHARKLLKPGGKLVMLELTRVWLGAGIVLGTFPGYWNGHNDGRRDSPFVDSKGWQQLLTTSGFSGIDISLDDHEQPYTLTSVMVATAVEPKSSIPMQPSQKPSVYLIYRDHIHPLGLELEKALLNGVNPIHVKLSEAPTIVKSSSRIISLVDISNNESTERSRQEFEGVKSLVSQASSVLWVYAGNPISGFRPESGVSVGLLRSLGTEFLHVNIASLGLEKSFPSNLGPVAKSVIEREYSLQNLEPGAIYDREYVLHNGTVHISRLEPEELLNARYTEMESEQANSTDAVLGSLGPVSLAVLKPNDMTTVYWSEYQNFTAPLQDGWVEVKVKAIHLDQDLAKSEANQGIVQFSGIVRHVGPSVKQLQPLDHVFGAVVGAPANLLRAPATSLAKLEERMTFAEASIISVSCMTGIYAMERVQEQAHGTMTLVFGADTPEGLAAAQWTFRYIQELVAIVEGSIDTTQDALNLAENKIFSVHDIRLEEKLAHYSSKNGEPHRVVLSYGGAESLVQAARFVNYGGVLIDLSGIGSQCYTQIAPLLVRKNASFETFSPRASIEAGASTIGRLMEHRKKEHPLVFNPILGKIEEFNTSQAESALTRALGVGSEANIVLTFDDELAMLRVRPTPKPVALDPNAAYIIAGGLGGLGTSIAKWMAERGARHLVFVSRTNGTGPDALDTIQELHTKGIKTDVVLCNGEDKEAVMATIKAISRSTTVKGVVHVATGEDNAAVESAAHNELESMFTDKVQGTINLHEATLQSPLDFFIMTSSVVGIIGGARQYLLSAANIFQDSLARYRRSQGLPSQLISFSPVLEVGWVADTLSVQTALQRIGLSSITEYEFLKLFELVLASPNLPPDCSGDPLTSCHLITGFEPRQLHKLHQKGVTKHIAWHSNTRFARLLTSVEDLAQNRAVMAQEKNVLDSLKHASPNERQDVVTQAMCKKLENLCYLTPGSIDPRKAVMTYGIDSMIAADFRSWLFKIFEIYISFLELLSPSTKIQGLVELVLENWKKTVT